MQFEKGSTSRKFGESIQWLIDANFVTPVFNVSLPILPLEAYSKEDCFKIYLSDIGLLVSMYGFDTKTAFLDNSLIGPAKGEVYENLVADMLTKRGYKLYYYKRDNNSQEIEFLLSQNSKIIPVEVKSGNSSTISLNNFISMAIWELAVPKSPYLCIWQCLFSLI